MEDPLEELQKKLYSSEKTVLPQEKPAPPAVLEKTTQALPPVANEFPASAWRKVWIGLALFVFLSVAAGAVIFYRGFYAFRKNQVVISLTGPETVAAGETAVWKVNIANRNQTDLANSQLVFQFPEYAEPVVAQGEANQFGSLTGPIIKQTIPIPQLGAGRLFEREFRAIMVGGENAVKKAQAVFKFTPSSSNIEFESSAEANLKISSFPATLNFSLPQETLSGETVAAVLNLKNESDASFNSLRVRLEYPSGFKLIDSSDKLSEFNNVWNAGGLAGQESKSLNFTGQVTGIANETKVFRAFIEGQEGDNWRVYKENSGEFKISVNPLSLILNSVGSTAPGDYAQFKLTWQNNLDVPLNNLTLKLILTGEPLDFSTLSSTGSFDAGSKTITWNKNNTISLSGLEPNQQDEVNVRIRLKDKSSGTIKLEAVIESASKPEGLSAAKISASSNLSMDVK